MAKSRLIGDYPVIGIRPTIDGRRGMLKVRESLEAVSYTHLLIPVDSRDGYLHFVRVFALFPILL